MTASPQLPADAPRVRLRVRGANNGDARVALLPHPLTLIGSRHGCAIRLQSTRVSPAHCAMVQIGRQLVMRDLASNAGTSVNDWESDACVLTDGDRLQIRSHEFLIRIESQADVSAAASGDTNLEDTNGHRGLAVRDREGQLLCVAAAPVVLVGRHSRCDLTIDDPKVSRAHALLYRVGNAWAVADLLSVNGATINGDRLTSDRVLADGDVLQLGSTELGVELGSDLIAIDSPADKPARPARDDNNDTIAGELQSRACALDARWLELEDRAAQLDAREKEVLALEAGLEELCSAARERGVKLEQDERRAARLIAELQARQARVKRRAAELDRREQALTERERFPAPANSVTTWEHELCGTRRRLNAWAVDMGTRLRHLVFQPIAAAPTGSDVSSLLQADDDADDGAGSFDVAQRA